MLLGADALVCAPQLRLRPKSRFGPLDEDRALMRAVRQSRGIDVPLPVVFGGRVIGATLGFTQHPGVLVAPAEPGWRCAIGSYDDVVSKITSSGKSRLIYWGKRYADGPTAYNWYDLWACGGGAWAPGAFGGAARTAVQKNGSTVGSLPLGGDVSPDTRYLLTSSVIGRNSVGDFLLYDRVLTYEACGFSASQQSMTNGVAAQRYIGAGEGGLKMMVPVESTTNATAANLTELIYTDQDGNGSSSMPTGRTVSVIVSVASFASPGRRLIAPADSGATVLWGAPFLPLASGDSGVRSVQTYTFSAAPTGEFTLVLCRPLAHVMHIAADGAQPIDQATGIEGHPIIYDSACLSLLAFFTTANTGHTFGTMGFAWG